MSYRQRDNINFDKDDFSIKSHLNISLEKSGISVSEALIQRTLDAINKQSSVSAEHEDSNSNNVKRAIPKARYLRGVAGVAAALLVAVAGLNVFNAFNNKGMDDSTKKDSAPEILMSTDMVKENANSEDTNGANLESNKVLYNGFTMDDKQSDMDVADNSTLDGGTSDNSTSDSSNRQMNEASAQDELMMQSNLDRSGVDDGKVTASAKIGLSFREIIPVDISQLEYIKISNKENGSSVLLNETQGISDFYTLMQPMIFTETALENDTSKYEIEIKEQTAYTLQLGAVLSVSYKDDTNTSVMTYSISDEEAILRIVSEYFR